MYRYGIIFEELSRGFYSRTYISQANILNQRRVNLRLGNDLLQKCVDDIVQVCVLEPALASLCERRAQRQGDDHIVGVFLCTAVVRSLVSSICSIQVSGNCSMRVLDVRSGCGGSGGEGSK